MHIEVDSVSYDDIKGAEGEESNSIRRRVQSAREVQSSRYSGTGVSCNASLDPLLLEKHCKLDDKSEILIKKAFEKLGLSVRAYTRVLKVARTIADLSGEDNIQFAHLSEALSYRCLDRRK